MTLAARLLLGVALVVGGAVLGFFGLFFLLYGGDSPDADPEVDIGGQTIDAQLVGAAGLGVALLLFVIAWLVIRPHTPRVPHEPS